MLARRRPHDPERRAHRAIVGPSGSGKTTLLRTIIGSVGRWRAASCGAAGLRLAYVPQVETVELELPGDGGRVRAHGPTHASARCRGRAARSARRSRRCSSASRSATSRERHIRELSGGQQQRVFVARALLRRARTRCCSTSRPRASTRASATSSSTCSATSTTRGSTIVLTTHDLNGIATHLPRARLPQPARHRRRCAGRGADARHARAHVRRVAWTCSCTTASASSSTRRTTQASRRAIDTPRTRRSVIEQLLEPYHYEFFRNGLARRHDRRRALRSGRRLRRAARHELHRPRALARDLRRLRRERAARRQLPHRRRALGRRLGARDQRASPGSA